MMLQCLLILHIYICNEAQDMLSYNQRLILDFIKETNGRSTDMNGVVRVSINHQGHTNKYNNGQEKKKDLCKSSLEKSLKNHYHSLETTCQYE